MGFSPYLCCNSFMNESSSLSPAQEPIEVHATGGRSALRRFARQHLFALAVLVAAVCLFRWPLVFGHYSFLDIGPDLADMTIPDLEFRAHALRNGSIPIWSNYHHGGQAFLGELLPGVLNPLSYLLLAMPLKNGHINQSFYLDYYVLLQCLAAISAYFLLRELACSRWAAVVGGLFYSIGGPPGNSIWLEFVTEIVYLPLILLFLFRSLRGHRPLANSAVAGAITGVCWFSGTHHFGLIISITGVATLLAFAVRKEWKSGLLRATVFAAVLAFVASPQILPAMEFSKLSVRWVGLESGPVLGSEKVPYQAHLIEYLHPSHLLDIPFGLDLSYWGAGMTFAGLVALCFVPFAVKELAPTRLLRLLAAFAVAGVLLSMSAWNQLYGIAYLLVPAFDKLRECLTWIILAHLAWTCGLGIGLTCFLARRDIPLQRTIQRILFTAAPILLLAAYVLTLIGKPELRESGDRLGISGLVALLIAGVLLLADRGVAKPATCALLLGGILMIEQGNVSGHGTLWIVPRTLEWEKRYTGPVAANDELARFLKSRPDLERIDVNQTDVPENFGEMHDIEEMSGHGASMLNSLLQLNGWPKTRQLYGVNYYLAKQPADTNQQLVYTAASGIKVFSNPGVRPRAWSVHKVIPVSNWNEAHGLLGDTSFDLSQATFVDRHGKIPTLEDCPASGDQVRMLQRTSWTVKIEANLQCKGLVILNDNFYPGWRASVDGQSAPVLPAYMSVRGVVVNAGKHIIEMHYTPWTFYAGIPLFLLGIAGSVILWRRDEPESEDLLA